MLTHMWICLGAADPQAGALPLQKSPTPGHSAFLTHAPQAVAGSSRPLPGSSKGFKVRFWFQTGAEHPVTVM